ncbi:Peptidyl-prolyl cis-trans isomerase E [Entamoeba marina]
MQSDEAQRRLYIGGLHEIVDQKLLYEAFLPFGEIVSVELPLDNNVNKGFGFVLFEEEDDAKQAIENMNHAELFGKILTVTIARNRVDVGMVE